MILAQALAEYGLASMMAAVRTTVASLESQMRHDPTPFYVIGALIVLVWWLFKR